MLEFIYSLVRQANLRFLSPMSMCLQWYEIAADTFLDLVRAGCSLRILSPHSQCSVLKLYNLPLPSAHGSPIDQAWLCVDIARYRFLNTNSDNAALPANHELITIAPYVFNSSVRSDVAVWSCANAGNEGIHSCHSFPSANCCWHCSVLDAVTLAYCNAMLLSHRPVHMCAMQPGKFCSLKRVQAYVLIAGGKGWCS